jgi:hypothetical protein
MQEDLRRLQSSHWIDHFVSQDYQGEWSVIFAWPGNGNASRDDDLFSSDNKEFS